MRENLSNLKGTRKTMLAARKSISKPSGLSQIGKIDQLIPNAEIRTPVYLIPKKPNLRVFVVNMPNATPANTSGLNFKVTEQIPEDAEGNQKQTEMENSSKSICEQYSSNRFTPVSTTGESGGVDNYGNKRSDGRVQHLSDRKKALKVVQEVKQYPRKTYRNSVKTSSHAKILENIKLKQIKEKLWRAASSTSRNGAPSNQKSNNTPFQMPQNSREINKVKHVKFSETESQQEVQRKRVPPPANGTHFTLHKVSGRRFPRILIRHRGNASRATAFQNVPVNPVEGESIPRLNMGKNRIGLDNLMGRALEVPVAQMKAQSIPRLNMGKDSIGLNNLVACAPSIPIAAVKAESIPSLNMGENSFGLHNLLACPAGIPITPVKAESIPSLNIRKNSIGMDNLMASDMAPMRYRMPKTRMAFSDPGLFFNRNLSFHSSARRMMGTATRGQDQDGPKWMYQSPFHSLQNPRPPFVPVLNPAGTSKFCGSANVRGNRRKPPGTFSKPLETQSRLLGGSKRDAARKQLQQEENARSIRDCDASSKERPNKGEDNKMSNTRRMLDDISKLLKNINEELSDDFECNGLELSLPIWKKELEQCILSVEKIKKALLNHQERK